MIKLHGFGGPSQFWDHNLKSFTLMAGLAAVTTRIKLFATCAVLTMPPPIAARMAVTIDSISHGRFGVNIISGWQRREYSQMGIWPGAEHYKRRYEYCAEYVTIMRELWSTGHSDYKGCFFTMDDCRCSPLPTARIPIICAGQSDAGTRFAAQYADYNFCSSFGVNKPTAVAPSVARLVAAAEETETRLRRPDPDDDHRGRDRRRGARQVGALQGRHRHGGDGRYRDEQAEDDPNKDPLQRDQTGARSSGADRLPTTMGVLVGSFETVARMLDELSAVPGVRGVMMTFDDFRRRHGAVRHPHPAADAMPQPREQGRVMLAAIALRWSRQRATAGRLHRTDVASRTSMTAMPFGCGRRSAVKGCAGRRHRQASPRVVSWLLVAPVAMILVLFFVLPTALFLVVSFCDHDRIGLYPAFLLDNYRELVAEPGDAAALRQHPEVRGDRLGDHALSRVQHRLLSRLSRAQRCDPGRAVPAVCTFRS